MKTFVLLATGIFTSFFVFDTAVAQSDTSLNICRGQFTSDGTSTFCLDSSGNDLLPELVDCPDSDGDGFGYNAFTDFGPGVGSCRVNTNLVRNGSFDNGNTGWNTFLHPDSVAGPFVIDGNVFDPNPFASSFTFEDGEVSFSFRDAGTQPEHSQLFTDPISLEGGRTYRLSFFATSTPSRRPGIGTVAVENGTDLTSYLVPHDFRVDAFDNRYQYAEFHVPVSDSNARVIFNLGDNAGGNNSVNIGGFEIRNVRLIVLNSDSAQVSLPENCDYSDAILNGGWGWDPIAEESCPPLPAQVSMPENCDYSDAIVNNGWGWDPIAQKSCPPLM